MTRPAEQEPPLVVDLDGTLIRTDLLFESFLALLKQNPLYLFVVPFWLLRGKAHMKQQIAERVTLDIETLPYHPALLTYIRDQHAAGRRLILATASHQRFALQVAEHLQLFSAVLASDASVNLKGERKRARLVAEFGEQGFDYAGNDASDLNVWRAARKAIAVNLRPVVQTALGRTTQIERTFEDHKPGLKTYLRALRLHQWLKNLLLFVPLLASHQFQEGLLLIQTLLAFFSFSFCASSVYVLNDLLDLTADRHHPRKRHRPFSAGELPVIHGLILIPTLLGSAIVIGLSLPTIFLGVLLCYYLLTLAYSFYLKQIVILDVLILAGLYTVRLIAGSAAVMIWPSFWLLAFSMFLFLSLALVKRYTELRSLRTQGGITAHGRSYQVGDLELLSSLGGASGYMAVLVLALYINGDTVKNLYTYPHAIWLLCPLLLYWISRVWLIAHRDLMHDDPIVFTLRDRISQLIMSAMAFILILAM